MNIPARGEGDKIAQMIANVLLHGAIGAKMRGNFRINLIPGTAHMLRKVTAQWGEIFIKLLAVAAPRMGTAHPFMRR